jgi:serpin B
LYQRLRAEGGNLIFSPASIFVALAITHAGATEMPEAEMAKTLHLELPRPELDKAMQALLASWKKTDRKRGFHLDVANRLWGQQGYTFLPNFIRVIRTVYGAELAKLDFRGQAGQACQTINRWVEDNTGQRITNLISSPEALTDARLVLTNAVYFKGEWHEPFYKGLTETEDFYTSADRKLKAPMMHRQGDFKYAAVDGLKILQVPYGDTSLSMLVLLPETVAGLNQLEKHLTATELQKWTDMLSSQEVNASLPNFKAATQLQLSDILKPMGMASAFDAAKADFSGMTGDRDLCISAVIHKAFVDVNEEGTEAAAATAVVMVPCSASFDEPQQKPPVFCADHPFVFLIRDNRTGSILFLGRIINPTSSSDWSPQVGQFKSSAAPWLPIFPARGARPGE